MSNAYRLLLVLIGVGLLATVQAAPTVTRLEVRIVTGAAGAPAGAYAELRLREAGRAERRLPLARGAAWPPASTRVVPVALAEPLDPDAVERVAIYFRQATGGAAVAWDIDRADVYAVAAPGREQLLAVIGRGSVLREGELAAAAIAHVALPCMTDADCDDHRMCNGRERCAPSDRSANALGCVAGQPVACPTNQVCSEGQGCRGLEATADAAAPREPPPAPAGSGVAAAREAPASAASGGVAVQRCRGRDVLLEEAGGTARAAACPAGTTCVAQPNGTGVCAPAR